MNTVPYTNARRAGRTQPGLIEILAQGDPRFRRNGQGKPLTGRAYRRSLGVRVAIDLESCKRPEATA